jgi:COMPASS component SWD1
MSLFHPSGTHLLAGTSRGSLLLFALSPDGERGGRLVQRVHLGAITPVREMAFDGAGRNLVVNSSDRAIRVYSVLSGRAAAAAAGEEAEENPVRLADAASYKFQDLVNRTPWNGIGFSGDSDYVYAGERCVAVCSRMCTC